MRRILVPKNTANLNWKTFGEKRWLTFAQFGETYSIAHAGDASVSLELGSSTSYYAARAVINTPEGIHDRFKYEQPSMYHYNTSFERFVEIQAWNEAFETAEMMGNAGLEPNIWRLAHALKETCNEKNTWSSFTELFSRLRSQELVQRNSEIFSFAMSACLQHGWSDLVIQLFKEMKELSMCETWAYLDALHAFKLQKDSDAAVATLRELLSVCKLSDDDYCNAYRYAMEACAENNQWDRVLSLFLETEEGEGKRDVACYRLALESCKHLQKPFLAKEYLTRILESNLVPDDFCYNYVISTVASAKRFEDVRNLFVDLADRRSAQSKKNSWICSTEESTWDVFQISFKACLEAGRVDLAEDIASRMHSLLNFGGKQSMSSKPVKISSADEKRFLETITSLCSGTEYEASLFIRSRVN